MKFKFPLLATFLLIVITTAMQKQDDILQQIRIERSIALKSNQIDNKPIDEQNVDENHKQEVKNLNDVLLNDVLIDEQIKTLDETNTIDDSQSTEDLTPRVVLTTDRSPNVPQ
jgi:hypothetical protein